MAALYTSTKNQRDSTQFKALPEGSKVLIVGNGMVGNRFCKSLIEEGVSSRCEVVVLSAEALPAYDRIHLSDFIDHEDEGLLLLKSKKWYEEHGIRLVLGEAVTKIDKSDQVVTSEKGSIYEYDILVFASGSHAYSPPIEGLDHANVILYRTIEDVKRIALAAKGKNHATIIGGGLLGLEASQTVQKLGLKATVVHLAAYLMSAQLNPQASEVLSKYVHGKGVDVLLSANTRKVEQLESGRLLITIEDGRAVETDLIIVAVGIRPNSEIAEEAGIKCGIRGGIIVNGNLETSHAGIYAIGECALFNGQIFGLAAPGYAMADYLASHLAGRNLQSLPKLDLSTKLKMAGVEVTTIGDPLESGALNEYNDGDSYKALNLSSKGELIGALGVGDWPESARIQTLYQERGVITRKEQNYFTKEGLLSAAGGESSVLHWPDERLICNCMSISKGEIIQCFTTCGKSADAIAKKTSCSEVCGSCRPLLEELCGMEVSEVRKPIGYRALMVSSVVAVVFVLGLLIAPSAPVADSVESWYYKVDKLWRDNVVKQITGYSVMGVFLVGLMISLRKRFRWFRFGHFNHWKVFHAMFGIISLIALFAHTGFHFGHNLNYWLMWTFVLINLMGGVAGVVSAVESSGTSKVALRARRIRPLMVYLHLILFWPLPILLAFHIASVYLY